MKPGKSSKKPDGTGKKVIFIGVVVVLLAAAAWIAWSQYRAGVDAKQVQAMVDEAREKRELFDDASGAMVILDKAIRIKEDHWEARYELGRAAMALNQVDKALENLERAAELVPASREADVHLQLGHTYRRRFEGARNPRDFSMAIASFNKAELNPDYEAEVLEALGFMALSKQPKDLGMAREHLTKLIRTYPNYEGLDRAQGMLDLVEKMLD